MGLNGFEDVIKFKYFYLERKVSPFCFTQYEIQTEQCIKHMHPLTNTPSSFWARWFERLTC